MMMKQLLLIVVAVAVLPAVAHAQAGNTTAAAKVPVARRLYDEGVDAANKGRWSLAHDRFKASYELAPRVLTLFNLAGSQAQTGRVVEATESYRRFMRETSDGRYPDLRSDATTQLDVLEKQAAQLTLDAPNIESDDAVMIDDVEFPHSALREPIPMNPGPHGVRIVRRDAAIASRTITLAPGAAESVRLELPATKADLHVRRPPGQPDASGTVTGLALDGKTGDLTPRRSVWRSPWLWGSVAIVVAGSLTTAYILTRPNGDVLVVR